MEARKDALHHLFDQMVCVTQEGLSGCGVISQVLKTIMDLDGAFKNRQEACPRIHGEASMS